MIVEVNGSRFDVQHGGSGYAHTKYRVTLLEGSWPSDRDLLTLCDNHDGTMSERHYGGVVSPIDNKPNERYVKVYTD